MIWRGFKKKDGYSITELVVVMGRNRKGFTLIEIVVVMAIIAVLAVLAVVAIGQVRQQAKRTRLIDDAKMIKTAVEAYYAKNKSIPAPVTGTYDRGGYQLIMIPDPSIPGSGSLNSFMRDPSNPPTNPSKEGSRGNVCYNRRPDLVSYNLWVVTEETAANISCPDDENKCTCGYSAVPEGDRLNVN
ncbi:prepilin-type N-terminal cleavage/methylation domain-containing protein [candidate division WS5 bacterium]|uniref:Prepilin-type N-terminal cleavage/methylation domain-containing protein n=1 Tax=candidate division WS5 bacterium TaxID=2093353 RepID=A0A419DFV7_9BACT|nr:MAG: prepilin-type N-terminal cleavage/methylation domain-containing protein [candidate division WS5 bacterium]